jgi:hypothetical protein
MQKPVGFLLHCSWETARGKLGGRQHFLSILKKTSAPDIHIFWQTPDLLNPQNPHPVCESHERD